MRGVDTNILVRLVVEDDDRQSPLARAFMRACREAKEDLYVPLGVTLELLWVLARGYKRSRDEILETLRRLRGVRGLCFEHGERIDKLLREAERSRIGLADLLIDLSAREAGCASVVTFDREAALAESNLFELLEEAP